MKITGLTVWKVPLTSHVTYTMAADVNHDICRAYDVESSGGVAFRGAFLIDPEGDVRAQLVNDLPLGRNIDELIRLVEALQEDDRLQELQDFRRQEA